MSSRVASAQSAAQAPQIFSIVRAWRVQQWVKNLLVFVPLAASHRVLEGRLLGQACLAFLAFSFCASGVYVFNDLLDYDSDRNHPRKKFRPVASGAIGKRAAWFLAIAPLVVGIALAAALLPRSFTAALLLYVIVANAYSIHLKKAVAADLITLAGLYALRMVAGGFAVGITPTTWLVAFSIFLFLSLAFVKRYSELCLLKANNHTAATRRDYAADDLDLIANLGASSGYIAVLVLALYINSSEVRLLYAHPSVLWLLCVLLLYWLTRLWFLARRGLIEGDPLVFTAKDSRSYIVAALGCLIILIASLKSVFVEMR